LKVPPTKAVAVVELVTVGLLLIVYTNVAEAVPAIFEATILTVYGLPAELEGVPVICPAE